MHPDLIAQNATLITQARIARAAAGVGTVRSQRASALRTLAAVAGRTWRTVAAVGRIPTLRSTSRVAPR